MGFCNISKGIGRLFRICRRLPCRWLARGEGESSKHHKSDSPELHCFHIALIVIKVFLFIIVFIIISVWQRYGKGTKTPSAKPIIWLPRVWECTCNGVLDKRVDGDAFFLGCYGCTAMNLWGKSDIQHARIGLAWFNTLLLT